MLRVLVLASLLALGGCGDACRMCLASSPRNPVATAEVEKIKLFDGERLPDSATSVYFREECTVDCTYWVRFTAPEGDARAFAERILKQRPRKDYNPMPEIGGGNEGPGFAWWPAKFPDGFEGEDIDRGGTAGSALVLKAEGGNATVWLTEFSK